MDPETAEPASSRRSLIGAIGAAGLASAAALVAARPASAAPYTTTPEDRELLEQAMGLELTARDLYLETIEAGVSDDILEVVEALSGNHSAYAQAIAAAIGASAAGRNEELYADLQPEFATTDTEALATAGWNLENSAVATHTELASLYESLDAVSLTGSILVVEARHATVLADIGGFSDDLDKLFNPQSEPLVLAGGTGGEQS